MTAGQGVGFVLLLFYSPQGVGFTKVVKSSDGGRR